MKVVHIIKEKNVKLSKKEREKMLEEYNNAKHDDVDDIFSIRPSMLYKTVQLKEPSYIVEMTNKEFQLVSFYLELERRKPITNVKLDTKLGED